MRPFIATRAVVLTLLLGWCAPRPATAAPLACQARASYEPSPPPVTVAFEAMAAEGAGSFAFHWEFGDGGTSTQQAPSHTYTETGAFIAQLTVTDAGSQESCRDTALVLVGIVADPVCIATASIRWGEAPLSVALEAYPVFACGPEPFTWTWRFGDGQLGAGPTQDHAYAEPGTYWAVATLHTPNGDCDCYPTLRISALTPDVALVEPPARNGGLRLEPARPSPFEAATAITFDLPRPGHTRLAVLDVAGRVVTELVNGFRPAGRSTVPWNGRDASGQVAPPGLYVAHLEHDGEARSTRLVRVR